MMRGLKIAACTMLLGFCSSAFAGTVLFSDSFDREAINDGGLQWVGKSGTTGDLHGTIVADPQNPDNRVLTFTHTASGGDAFTSSAAFQALAGQFYELKFDYLGVLTDAGGLAGGFIGVSTGTAANHNWLAGDQAQYIPSGSGLPLTIIPSSPASRVLQDDGEWHTYSILFQSKTNQALRVMIEDFASPAGNAFFDNVQVSAVPVPAAAWTGGALMGMLGLVRVLRRR